MMSLPDFKEKQLLVIHAKDAVDNKLQFKHSVAVDNTLKLFDAAKNAGVKRVVHISILNASENSHLEYFKDKGKLEQALIDSGISHAILRPTVLFGKEDILINNIAWFLRKFPVFGVFGDGNYQIQPTYVDDLAELAVEQGIKDENTIIDAIGPETFTYRELVGKILLLLALIALGTIFLSQFLGSVIFTGLR